MILSGFFYPSANVLHSRTDLQRTVTRCSIELAPARMKISDNKRLYLNVRYPTPSLLVFGGTPITNGTHCTCTVLYYLLRTRTPGIPEVICFGILFLTYHQHLRSRFRVQVVLNPIDDPSDHLYTPNLFAMLCEQKQYKKDCLSVAPIQHYGQGISAHPPAK